MRGRPSLDLRADSSGMAVGAADLGQIADIERLLGACPSGLTPLYHAEQ